MKFETWVVIPAYNEAGCIGRVVRNSKKYVDQVIVVDDCSIDKTSDAAKEAGACLQDKKIQIIKKITGYHLFIRKTCSKLRWISNRYLV